MSIKQVAAKQAAKHTHDQKADKVREVVAKKTPTDDQRWSFSYRYFQEIKNFGLDSASIDKKWMLSVVYRLQELSKLTISEVVESRTVVEGSLRIHDINWQQKNIPIKRTDLSWIDDVYLKNPEEYPIMQLAVSKALGRIIGFFDERNSFQIILLDPLHNAQPSKFNGYKVQQCRPLGCEITTVLNEARKAVAKISDRDCDCAADLEASLIWKKLHPGGALVIPSSDDGIIKDADDVIELGLAAGYEEIVRAGVEALIAKA